MSAVDTARPTRVLLEVQALRAVAVGLVLLYHVWPGRVPGGFIGVDVFFVISGFLITAHLLREYETVGRISLSSFWMRRIRRLLPAALVVLAVCVLLAFTVLPEATRVATLRQVGGAAAYVLNWVLAADAVDYLASDNAATVAQHYWTLSVEEQFYIVWPILLVVVLWLVARRRLTTGRALPSTVVFWTATAAGLLSFGYSVFLTWYSPAIAFFATPTRAWEFAVGAIFAAALARWPDAIERARRHPLVSRAALPTLAGLAMIVGSSFLMSGQSAFPGWIALFPVVGAALVIAGGLPQTLGLPAIVGLRPVQFVGDISYSLYLWHWPLIVTLLAINGRPPTVLEGVALIAASVVLAAITRFTVEGPARTAPIFSRRLPAFALALVGALAFVGIYGVTSVATEQQVQQERAASEARLIDPAGCFGAHAMLGGSDCPDRFELSEEINLTAAASDLDTVTWCLTWFTQDWLSCERGDVAAPNGTVAIVGDSHAASLMPALSNYLQTEGIGLITYLRYACPGLGLGTEGLETSAVQEQERDCREWSDRVHAELESRDDIDTVIYTNFSSAYVDPERLPQLTLTVDDIVARWQGVIDSGKQVIFITDPPATDGEDVPTCLEGKVGEPAPCSRSREEALTWDPHVDAAAQVDGEVTIIDTADAFCDSDRCYAVIGDVVVYPDSNHLSGFYATTLMRYLGPEILDARLAR